MTDPAVSVHDRSTEWRFPPLRWIAYFLAYLVAVDIAILPLELFVSFDVITILILPILEETIKFYVARKRTEYAFYGLALFGFMELILVKGFLLIEAPLGDLPLLLAFALMAFAFHLSTAVAYARAGPSNRLVAVYGACLGLHIVFNANDLVLHDVSWQLAINALLALMPLVVGILICPSRPRKAIESRGR